jgi:hypothetical protein
LPCLGYSSLGIILTSSGYYPISSFDVVVGESFQLYALAIFSNGTLYNATGSATWSSSDTAVASVATGLVTAVGGGSSQITGSISLVAPGVKAFGCGGCPGQQVMTAGAGSSIANTTPSQHTYPDPPLQNGCYVGTPFDAPVGSGKHNAQDVKSSGIAVGTPVYAAEGGTVTAVQSGIAHDPNSNVFNPGTSTPKCAGKAETADYVWITGSDGAVTKYYHVTPTVSNGQRVTAGQQIGTVDVSGCSSGPHVHVQREVSGSKVNFVLTNCAPNASKYDLGNTWYDDGPF